MHRRFTPLRVAPTPAPSHLSQPFGIVIPTGAPDPDFLLRAAGVFPSRNYSNLSHPSRLVIPNEVEGSAVRPAARSTSSWKATRRNHPCPSICRSSSAPEATIQRAVLDGFRYVAYGDGGLCVEISDGASHFHYPVMGSRTQALLLHSPLQKPFSFR